MVTTIEQTFAAEVALKPYDYVFEEYFTTPRRRALAPTGSYAAPTPVGCYITGPSSCCDWTVLGKESNELDAVQADLIHDPTRSGSGTAFPAEISSTRW